MFNADFSDWPIENSAYKVHDIQVNTVICPGFLCGSGAGGRVLVSRVGNPLNYPGLPFEARYFIRMQWLAAGTGEGQEDGWMTVLEHGECYGAPHSLGGVRRFAGQNVAASIYARCPNTPSPVPLRIVLWQSFGYGPEASPMVLMPGGYANVGQTWMQVGHQFSLPNMNGKVIGSGGGDYLGFGVDIPSGYAPTLDLCLANCEPV